MTDPEQNRTQRNGPQQTEPSMEEILASIRRIVFESDDGAMASGARAGRPAADETAVARAPQPAGTVAPAAEPPRAGTGVSGGSPGAARTVPPAPPEAPAPDPRGPEFADRPAIEVAPDAEIVPETDAAPGDDVLLLTEMIAPDGSVVRLDPRPAGTGRDSAGGGPGEAGLEPAAQGELAAAVRDWLDRNAPDLIDRAARRELQKQAGRRA